MRDGWDRPPFGEFMERGRTWKNGMERLFEIMKPEDMEKVSQALRAMGKDFRPEDLQDQGRMLEKLSQGMNPEEMARMMQIFSEFMGSEEGREMAGEVEEMMKRLDGFSKSPRGKRVQEGLERIQKRFERDGKRIELRMERRTEPQREEQPRPEGSKLY